MPTHTQLKGVTSHNQSLLSDQLESNLKLFLDWAFLGVGAFTNVTLPLAPTTTSGPHRLRLSDDPDYTRGRVWEGFKKDWVWETGIDWGISPINISGVWINGAFKSLSITGTYAHNIDYPNGRIVFSTAIPTGTHVAAEYSYRKYQVYAGEPDWFREVQIESDWTNPQFTQIGSGAWSAMADARVQTPAIVISATSNVTNIPKELGNLVQHRKQIVVLDVLSDNPKDMKWAHDALVGQEEKTLRLFDFNQVIRNDKWPLNGAGNRKSGALMYPSLVNETGVGGYYYNKCYVSNAASQDKFNRPPLNHSSVFWNCEVDVA